MKKHRVQESSVAQEWRHPEGQIKSLRLNAGTILIYQVSFIFIPSLWTCSSQRKKDSKDKLGRNTIRSLWLDIFFTEHIFKDALLFLIIYSIFSHNTDRVCILWTIWLVIQVTLVFLIIRHKIIFNVQGKD